MESHIKQRLVGAVILVALIVILVPELLSGSKQASAPPPAQPEPPSGTVRTYTIDLSSPDTPDTLAETPAEPAAQVPAPATPPDKPQASESQAAPASAPTPPPAPAAQQSISETAGWAVQLGSFSNRENAERLTRELNAKGYKAFVSQTGSGAKTRHRVRVGPEQDRARAENLAQRLKREGRQVAIVAHP